MFASVDGQILVSLNETRGGECSSLWQTGSASDADPTQIAAAVLAIWEEIDDALTPIVGAQGLVALYRRTVHLAAAQHPWLAGRDEGVPHGHRPGGAEVCSRAAQQRRSCGRRQCVPQHLPRVAGQPDRPLAHRAIAAFGVGHTHRAARPRRTPRHEPQSDHQPPGHRRARPGRGARRRIAASSRSTSSPARRAAARPRWRTR